MVFHRSLRRSLTIPRRLFRAFLAEPYDGIGQYALVSLARSSTSSAVKARVASGDFGGGRVFPAGTPVAVFSNRGLLEVLSLGNLPAAAFEIIEDYDRIENNGWGSTSLINWNTSQNTNDAVSMDGSIGRLQLDPIHFNTVSVQGPGTTGSALDKAWTSSCELWWLYKFDNVPDGGLDTWLKLWIDEIDSKDWNILDIGAQVSSVSGQGSIFAENSSVEKLDWTPNVWYQAKAEINVEAVTLKFKTWIQGTAEPEWQIERALSLGGSNDLFVRIISQRSPAASGGDPIINTYYDDLKARTLS